MAQPEYVMDLDGPFRFHNSWGTILVVKQRSRRERFVRKKYMGV
jgi:hypothetical protein